MKCQSLTNLLPDLLTLARCHVFPICSKKIKSIKAMTKGRSNNVDGVSKCQSRFHYCLEIDISFIIAKIVVVVIISSDEKGKGLEEFLKRF